MKQVLVINGHPDIHSFNYALSEAYIKGADRTDSIISQIICYSFLTLQLIQQQLITKRSHMTRALRNDG